MNNNRLKALQILADLDYQDKRTNYKGVPTFAIPRTRFSDRTSNGLTQCILTWCKLHDHYAVRVSTTGRKLKDTVIVDVIGRAHTSPGKWIPGTTRKGTSDIHASIHGRHCSIEVKVGKDRMSPEQLKTKQSVEASGGLYYMAKDFQSFYEWYNSLGSSP